MDQHEGDPGRSRKGATGRALVLGGGGAVGLGWQIGLLEGLSYGGVTLTDADRIIGTSAGAIMGAFVALGREPRSAFAFIDAFRKMADLTKGFDPAGLMKAAAAAIGKDNGGRRALGRLALAAQTVSEAEFIGLFDDLAGAKWPIRFTSTAINAETGVLRVVTAADGLAVDRAVAASAAVPLMLPPITLGDHRYIDGGLTTHLNASLAAGAGRAVVISCFPIHLPLALGGPMISALAREIDGELEEIHRAGGKIEMITPDLAFLWLVRFGMRLMDVDLIQQGYKLGLRQGRRSAKRFAPSGRPPHKHKPRRDDLGRKTQACAAPSRKSCHVPF